MGDILMLNIDRKRLYRINQKMSGVYDNCTLEKKAAPKPTPDSITELQAPPFTLERGSGSDGNMTWGTTFYAYKDIKKYYEGITSSGPKTGNQPYTIDIRHYINHDWSNYVELNSRTLFGNMIELRESHRATPHEIDFTTVTFKAYTGAYFKKTTIKNAMTASLIPYWIYGTGERIDGIVYDMVLEKDEIKLVSGTKVAVGNEFCPELKLEWNVPSNYKVHDVIDFNGYNHRYSGKGNITAEELSGIGTTSSGATYPYATNVDLYDRHKYIFQGESPVRIRRYIDGKKDIDLEAFMTLGRMEVRVNSSLNIHLTSETSKANHRPQATYVNGTNYTYINPQLYTDESKSTKIPFFGNFTLPMSKQTYKVKFEITSFDKRLSSLMLHHMNWDDIYLQLRRSGSAPNFNASDVKATFRNAKTELGYRMFIEFDFEVTPQSSTVGAETIIDSNISSSSKIRAIDVNGDIPYYMPGDIFDINYDKE